MLFVRLFDLRLFGFVFLFSWCLGSAAACDCGTPWTFILPCLGGSEHNSSIFGRKIETVNKTAVFSEESCENLNETVAFSEKDGESE